MIDIDRLIKEATKYKSKGDVDKEVYEPNSYKFGSDFVKGNFSLRQAINSLGLKEIKTPSEFGSNFRSNSDEMDYGISDVSGIHFYVAPYSKDWLYTILHECGHMIIEKTNINKLWFEREILGTIGFAELRAEWFSFFCLKELGELGVFRLGATNIFEAKKADFPIYEEDILEAQRKAKEFIALGRS